MKDSNRPWLGYVGNDQCSSAPTLQADDQNIYHDFNCVRSNGCGFNILVHSYPKLNLREGGN
jgi:hypothetical protein